MMTVSFGMGPLGVFVSGGGGRLVIDDLEDFAAHESLQRFMIHVGVSDLALLIGTEMEYLTPG